VSTKAKADEKRTRFVDEYLVDLNATQAAIRAGYSPKTAKQQGSRLLTYADVSAAIAAKASARSQRTGITADFVLGELYRLASVDIAGAFDEHGTLLPIHQIPEDVRRAISAIEVDEIVAKVGNTPMVIGHTKKVKFWDKRGSLQDLGRHLKLFVDRVEHDVTDALADRLAAARKRADAA
jgi:phage terminase small subunit